MAKKSEGRRNAARDRREPAGALRVLKAEVKRASMIEGHDGTHYELKAYFQVVSDFKAAGRLDDLETYCLAALSRKARKNTSIFHLLIALAGGSASSQTVSTWTISLRNALAGKIKPSHFIAWLKDGGGVKTTAEARRKSRKPKATAKKRSAYSGKAPKSVQIEKPSGATTLPGKHKTLDLRRATKPKATG